MGSLRNCNINNQTTKKDLINQSVKARQFQIIANCLLANSLLKIASTELGVFRAEPSASSIAEHRLQPTLHDLDRLALSSCVIFDLIFGDFVDSEITTAWM